MLFRSYQRTASRKWSVRVSQPREPLAATTAMPLRPQKRAMIVLFCVAATATGWSFWARRASHGSGGASPSDLEVLCDHCGYLGRTSASELVSHGDAARMPAFGPGFRCPKCGDFTLYANPMVCTNCQIRYLIKRDAHGGLLNKCPKCGKLN